jgi:hypothetical protein
VPGTRECSTRIGGTVRFCDAGAWKDERTCDNLCTSGACTGQCRPGDRDCAGLTPRRCSTDGAWTNEPSCQFACQGAGQCTVCDPGRSKRCSADGTRLEICTADGSGYTTLQSCGSGCNSTRLECNVCRPGTSSACTGGQRSTCNSDGTAYGPAQCDSACGGQLCAGVCAKVESNYCLLGDGSQQPPTVMELCEIQRLAQPCDGTPSGESCDRQGLPYLYLYRRSSPGMYDLERNNYWVCDVDGTWGVGG